MQKITLFICAFFLVIGLTAQNTMTFDSGASETGFTFTNWNAESGIIYSSDLRNSSSFSDDEGTFTFTSFDVTGFFSDNTIEVTSDLGNSFTYSTATAQTHTLNWVGVTTITFNRISGSGQASDHDNFVYTPSETLSVKTINEENAINIFPNPVKETLTVSRVNENTTFYIYDITGRKISSGKLNLDTINVEVLKTGNYFLELNDGSEKYVERFVKL